MTGAKPTAEQIRKFCGELKADNKYGVRQELDTLCAKSEGTGNQARESKKQPHSQKPKAQPPSFIGNPHPGN
jgi:hypothetical protein